MHIWLVVIALALTCAHLTCFDLDGQTTNTTLSIGSHGNTATTALGGQHNASGLGKCIELNQSFKQNLGIFHLLKNV